MLDLGGASREDRGGGDTRGGLGADRGGGSGRGGGCAATRCGSACGGGTGGGTARDGRTARGGSARSRGSGGSGSRGACPSGSGARGTRTGSAGARRAAATRTGRGATASSPKRPLSLPISTPFRRSSGPAGKIAARALVSERSWVRKALQASQPLMWRRAGPSTLARPSAASASSIRTSSQVS